MNDIVQMTFDGGYGHCLSDIQTGIIGVEWSNTIHHDYMCQYFYDEIIDIFCYYKEDAPGWMWNIDIEDIIIILEGNYTTSNKCITLDWEGRIGDIIMMLNALPKDLRGIQCSFNWNNNQYSVEDYFKI